MELNYPKYYVFFLFCFVISMFMQRIKYVIAHICKHLNRNLEVIKRYLADTLMSAELKKTLFSRTDQRGLAETQVKYRCDYFRSLLKMVC